MISSNLQNPSNYAQKIGLSKGNRNKFEFNLKNSAKKIK